MSTYEPVRSCLYTVSYYVDIKLTINISPESAITFYLLTLKQILNRQAHIGAI